MGTDSAGFETGRMGLGTDRSLICSQGLASKLLSAKKRRAGGAHALPAEIPYESLAPLQKLWGEHAAAALSAKGCAGEIDTFWCLYGRATVLTQ